MKKIRARSIVSTILSFMTALLLTMVLFVSFVYYGLFYNNALDETASTEYYEASYDLFCRRAGKYLKAAGLPGSLLEEVYPYQRFYIQEHSYLVAAGNDDEYKLPAEELRTAAYDWIRSYCESMEVKDIDSYSDEIMLVADRITEEYRNVIELPWTAVKQKYREQYNGGVMVFAAVSVILLIGLGVWQLLMYRRKFKALRYLAYSCIASAVMCSGLLYIYRQRIQMCWMECSERSYSLILEKSLLRSYEYGMLSVIVSAAGALLLIGVILLLKGRNSVRGVRR